MTRLRTDDIENISAELKSYDAELLQKTGRTLRGVACHALNTDEISLEAQKGTTIGIIPIQSGQGVITGFTQTLCRIVEHLGFPAYLSRAGDVGGIAEAAEHGAQVLLMADDLQFIALHLAHRRIVDNAEATGKGFVAALDLMCGGVGEREILVLGCGPVGRHAALAAVERGAKVVLSDPDVQRRTKLAEEIETFQHTGKPTVWPDLIIDATNAADVIDEEVVNGQTYIAAPGMPLGLTAGALEKIGDRLIHDPLQLGVVLMVIEAVISNEANS